MQTRRLNPTPTHQPFPEHKKRGSLSSRRLLGVPYFSNCLEYIYKDSLFSCQHMTDHQYYNILYNNSLNNHEHMIQLLVNDVSQPAVSY